MEEGRPPMTECAKDKEQDAAKYIWLPTMIQKYTVEVSSCLSSVLKLLKKTILCTNIEYAKKNKFISFQDSNNFL